MPDLTVAKSETEFPKGPHLRVRCDVDSALVGIYDGDELLTVSSYHFVRNYDSWTAARNAAVEDAREKWAIIQKYGRGPDPEVIEL